MGAVDGVMHGNPPLRGEMGGSHGLLHTAKDGIRKVSNISSKLVVNPESLQNVFKVAAYGMAAMELMAHAADGVVRNNVKAALHAFSSLVDATRFFEGFRYFYSGDWKLDDANERHYKLAGKAMLLIGGLAGAGAFFLEKSAVEMGQVASSVGRSKVFTTLTDIKLLRRIGTPCIGVGLTLLATDCMVQIICGKDVTSSWFWLANSVSEVAFITFILAGGVNPVATTIFGLTAATTGLAAHIYSVLPKAEAK